MADAKISSFTDATSFGATDDVTGLQGGGNVNFSGNVVRKGITGRKLYAANITQLGTSAPDVNLLHLNQLGGSPVWARTGTGTFTFTVTGAFLSGKVPDMSVCIYNATNNDGYSYTRTSDNVVTVQTFRNGSAADSLFFNAEIEIYVYD